MHHGLEQNNILWHHLQVGLPKLHCWPVNYWIHLIHPKTLQASTGPAITTNFPCMDKTNIWQPSTIIHRTIFLSTPWSLWHPPTSRNYRSPNFICQSHIFHHVSCIRHTDTRLNQRYPSYIRIHHQTPKLLCKPYQLPYPFFHQRHVHTRKHKWLLYIWIQGPIPLWWLLISWQKTNNPHQQKLTIFTTQKWSPTCPTIHNQIFSIKCHRRQTRRPFLNEKNIPHPFVLFSKKWNTPKETLMFKLTTSAQL